MTPPTISTLLAPAVAPAPAEGYEPVAGRDTRSVELERMIEARAAAKTASDYVHVVWAYGVIWSLFAVYGLVLWRRVRRVQADVRALTSRLDAS